ncbi:MULTISPECIES: gene transfer agent family protein [unclassified Rhizobium]|uniref:gene transfer agent family protein n=1 Tax=unclassified Rhizobium TaxID=2613769 RepID=UPI001ADD5981|nr:MULTISPECIES: gene transfer agent family protein [unclassified Rhizobium]MBO9100001.1 gene transfer agent family protein [Rhizobium sp. L58/93]QXZ82812.1 gene transfer agent family protein [Rhizobium sp. K1/93]QXZ89675.1 gene transfer agent family protein [Rhizobium sp. K15/93]
MRDAKVELAFADGDYPFRLSWGNLVELQEQLDAGPYAVLNRLNSDEWKVQDISQIIRLGLIGGDKDLHPVKARKLVERYVEERPPLENLPLARVILMTALFGAPDEPAGAGAKGDEIETSDGKLKTKDIYGAGAVMGFSPQQINEMTVWQFMAAFDGYVKHHSDEGEKLSEKDADELFEWLTSKD